MNAPAKSNLRLRIMIMIVVLVLIGGGVAAYLIWGRTP